MARIVSRICELDYKRPALAMRESGDDRTNHNRLGAFLAQCARKPWLASIPPFLFEHANWDEGRFLKWLRRHKPDVLVAADEQVIDALESSQVKILGDMGVVLYYKEQRVKKYSGLFVDSGYVGEVAAKLLISMIENNQRGLPAMSTATYVDASRWDVGEVPRSL
jgi:LacI family transcriptional regulator